MWWWTIQNLVVTAILAALVWLACRLLRVGPAARHALWLVVLLKMLTPPLVAWPWAVGNADWLSLEGVAPVKPATPVIAHRPQPPMVSPTVAVEVPVIAPDATTAVVTPADVGVTGQADVAVVPDIHPPITLPPAPVHDHGHVTPAPLPLPKPRPVFTAPPPPKLVIPVPSPEPERPRWADWLRISLGWTWLGGSALFLLIQVVRIARMHRRLRGSTTADAELQEQVATLAAKLGVKPPQVRLVRGIGSPAIFCMHRPMLLWPADLDVGARGAVRGLIVHELAHIRRRDHWVGWVELLAGCVWWWSPLFWYARHQLRESAELACDAWVVDVLPGGRRAYAEGLLSVCEFISRRVAPMPAVGVNTGGRRFLERRLAMIMRDNVSLRIPRFGFLTIVLLAATALPAWSQHEERTTATPAGATPARTTGTIVAEEAKAERTTAAYSTDETRLPPAAHELVSRFHQHQVQALLEVMQELQEVRARCSPADPGAAAIDRRIAQYQQQLQMLTGGGGVNTRYGVQPDPGNLYGFRDRVGQTFQFEVTGKIDDRSVWGGADGFYTDDSPLALAAVHAGILRPGEHGVVRVEVTAGRPSYRGSTANGVTTRDYLTWGGSYRVSRAGEEPDQGAESLAGYRGRNGHILSLIVVGNARAGAVWGGEDGVYTDDSAIAAAAVHAGVLQDGQRGRVRVEILPARATYSGCTKNGVVSGSYGEWGGSYRILSGGDSAPVVSSPAPVSLSSLRGHNGESFLYQVTGSTSGTIWGGDRGVYTDDSPLAVAAVHAGILRDGQTGAVKVTILAGCESYPAVMGAGGITSHSWSSFGGSYKIEAANAVGPVAPPPPRVNTPRVQSAPVPNNDIDSSINLSQLRGQNNAVVYVQVTGDASGTVWGSDIYTDDSSIAAAAVHAGILKVGEKGVVKVKVLPGREEYSGCERNGVTSRKYASWGGSFSLERAAAMVPGSGGDFDANAVRLLNVAPPALHNYTRGLEDK